MFTKLLSRPIFRLSVVILVNENILLRSTPVLCKDIKYKQFSRWTVRKPSKVYSPEQISSGSIDSEEFFKSEYTDNESLEKKTEEHPKEPDCKLQNKRNQEAYSNEKEDSSGLEYKVLEENDFIFSKLMTYVGTRKMRRRHDLIMLEGKRLNLDALQAGLKPKKFFFTQKSFLDELNLPAGSKIPLFKIPYKTVKLWSKLDTPPGIIGFYGIPKESDITIEEYLPVKVVCDNVRDPGNMGSIIRVAACVGCKEIILMKGCTDPWDSKVLRAASGGHFHVPIKMDLSWKESKDFLHPADVVVIADSNKDRTDTKGNNLPHHEYYNTNYSSVASVVVVIGGETEGISQEAFRMAMQQDGCRVYIPLSNSMESLNSGCALSVVLFEIKRQFLMKEYPEAPQTLLKNQSESCFDDKRLKQLQNVRLDNR